MSKSGHCQTTQSIVYRIEARINPKSTSRGITSINGKYVMESWKEINYDPKLLESIDGLEWMSKKMEGMQALLCWCLSGDMAGLIVHHLTLKHQFLEFRIIPINYTMSWELGEEEQPMKIDLTFKAIEQPND